MSAIAIFGRLSSTMSLEPQVIEACMSDVDGSLETWRFGDLKRLSISFASHSTLLLTLISPHLEGAALNVIPAL